MVPEVALTQSECDRFARRHYQHAADGIYVDRDKLEEIRAGLRLYEQGHYFEGVPLAEEGEFAAETLAGGDDDDAELFEEAEALAYFVDGSWKGCTGVEQ